MLGSVTDFQLLKTFVLSLGCLVVTMYMYEMGIESEMSHVLSTYSQLLFTVSINNMFPILSEIHEWNASWPLTLK